jgi:SAM-dependent methyltransferase
MDVRSVSPYRCLWCGNPLRADWVTQASRSPRCDLCGRDYSVVEGIPILTLRSESLLRAWHKKLQDICSRIHGMVSSIQHSHSEVTHINAPTRLQLARFGMEANLKLFDIPLNVLAGYLHRDQFPKLGLLDYLPNSTDLFSPDYMLPYFVQDWGDSPDFARVKSLVIEALRSSCSEAANVAVLGAGACGIVQAVAGTSCAKVHGVDLSLPVMMLARRLLSGESLVVHLSEASWRPIKLNAQERRLSKIDQLIADVHTLPFLDDSLSCVVTQYLMEVIGSPPKMMEEILRVLKPGGMWISFSIPFRDPVQPWNFGPLTPDEFESYMNRSGFEVVEQQTENFSFIDLERIDPSADQFRHRVQFFVARRLEGKPGAVQRGAVMGHYWSADDRWWDMTPMFELEKGVEIASSSRFRRNGPNVCAEVKFFNSICQIANISVPDEEASRLKALLDLVGDNRTNREIYRLYSARMSSQDPMEFRELMYYLTYQYGILRLS